MGSGSVLYLYYQIKNNHRQMNKEFKTVIENYENGFLTKGEFISQLHELASAIDKETGTRLASKAIHQIIDDTVTIDYEAIKKLIF
jgi:hypothetical protein